MADSDNAIRQKELLSLATALGVKFRDINLLDTALTHTSYANEAQNQQRVIKHNERLEFLGDAVLELAMSDWLYKKYPQLSEGDLTKARASVVCEASLCRRATALDFGNFLRLGHGEKMTGGDKRPSILADAFEAVIGAIYLDQGWDAAKQYVAVQLDEELKEITFGQQRQDYKTKLQEIVQRKKSQRIDYEMVSAVGPDHEKIFTARVLINGKDCGSGQGHSKKEAEQAAAREALRRYKD